jgi:hypothetical protein
MCTAQQWSHVELLQLVHASGSAAVAAQALSQLCSATHAVAVLKQQLLLEWLLHSAGALSSKLPITATQAASADVVCHTALLLQLLSILDSTVCALLQESFWALAFDTTFTSTASLLKLLQQVLPLQ